MNFNAFKIFVEHQDALYTAQSNLECGAFEHSKFLGYDSCETLRNIPNTVSETETISLNVFYIFNLIVLHLDDAFRS